jgi:hypothetical protein
MKEIKKHFQNCIANSTYQNLHLPSCDFFFMCLGYVIQLKMCGKSDCKHLFENIFNQFHLLAVCNFAAAMQFSIKSGFTLF